MSPKKAAAKAAKGSDDQVDRIVGALTADTSPLRERALGSLVTFVLDEPVSTWISPEDVVELLQAAVTGPNVAQQIDRHADATWERYVARCEVTQDTLGDGLPDDARDRITRLILETKPPAAKWADDAVDPALLRALFAPALQELLLGFAKNLPLPGVGGGGPAEPAGGGSKTGFGLRSRLKQSVEKRAEKFVEAGKSVLGGMERQVQALAKDFSEGAGRDFRRAMKARLRSEEGRALAEQIVRQALDAVLDTPLAEFNKDTAALPLAEIYALAAPIAEHNRERAPIVDAVREELEVFVAGEGQRTARELLVEADMLDITLAKAMAHLDGPTQRYFASDDFRGVLAAMLEV